MTSTSSPTLSIVVLGSQGVGKSSLIAHLTNGSEKHTATLNVDGTDCDLVIEELGNISEASQEVAVKANGFLMAFSVTDRKSYDSASEHYDWVLRQMNKDTVPTVLVGNKQDQDMERNVGTAEGSGLAETWGVPFFETSATQGHNVNEAFVKLVQEITRIRKKETAATTTTAEKKSDCALM